MNDWVLFCCGRVRGVDSVAFLAGLSVHKSLACVMFFYRVFGAVEWVWL